MRLHQHLKRRRLKQFWPDFMAILILYFAGYTVIEALHVVAKSTGSEFVYDYDVKLDVRKGGLHEITNEKTTSLALKTVVKYALKWYDDKDAIGFFKMGNVDLKLHQDGKEILSSVEEGDEFHVHFSNCKPMSILSSDGHSSFATGIASLFNYRSQSWEGMEQDLSGNCTSHYWSDRQGFHKTRAGCYPSENEGSLFGVKMDSHFKGLFNFLRSPGSKFICSDSAYEPIEEVQFEQKLKHGVLLLPQVGTDVVSRQKLILKEQRDFDGFFDADDYNAAVKKLGLKETLLWTTEVELENDAPQFQNIFSKYKKHLKSGSLAKIPSAKAFKAITVGINQSSLKKDEFLAILKDKSNTPYLPQLMDVFGSSSNYQAHQAVLEIFGNPAQTNNPDLCERYLWAVAQSIRVLPSVVKDLIKAAKGKIQDDKLSETLLLTLGTLSRKTSCVKTSVMTLQFLIKNLQNCKKQDCTLIHLKALRNTQNPKVSPILLEMARSGGKDKKDLAVGSMKALLDLPVDQVKDVIGVNKIKNQLWDLFHDGQIESTIRAMAAEMLALVDGTFIFDVLQVLPKEKKTFQGSVLGRLEVCAKVNPEIKAALRSSVKKGLMNWNLLSSAGGGMSGSLSRDLLVTPTYNASFSFDLEVAGSMLKRSNIDFYASAGKSKTSFLQLDTFGGGFSEYVTPDPDEEPDLRAPHAGMQMTVVNNQLRPFVFFKSSSELMSLYWSGKAEEKTSAIQGNIMIQNHVQTAVMPSGLVVILSGLGTLSFDSSGQASVSIWSKEAETVVENAGAYVFDTHCKVCLGDKKVKVLLDVQESFQTEASLNVNTDVGFGQTYQMCLRMTQPESKYTIGRWLVVGSKRIKTSTRKQLLPGRSVFLSKTISDLCNAKK